MKKLLSLLSLLALCSTSYSKTVDQNTAQTVAFNYYKAHCSLENMDGLSLVYTATSTINGAEVVDFYVFNTITSKGFIIVSGDDNIIPVLAYSTESAFNSAFIPSDVNYWLNEYKRAISGVIEQNIIGTQENTEKWTALIQPYANHLAAKTTVVAVAPLTKTAWDQSTYYNTQCPYDNAANGRTLTGCVATAMCQVMKYWKWPDTARNVNTYLPANNGLGQQVVNFASSVFLWDDTNMPLAVTSNKTNVTKLMYNAGVSVNMNYGVNLSGSYVLLAESPINNCAEYAFPTYFRYKPTIKGLQKSSFTITQWNDSLYKELAAHRPFLYEGQDPTYGGHCWVCDGCDVNNNYHFNWGWSGSYNGYFAVTSITPPGYNFTSSQGALVNIIPDTPVHTPTGMQQIAITHDLKIFPNPAKSVINVSSETEAISEIHITDMLGHELIKNYPANNQQLISIQVGDLASGVYFIQLNTDKGVMSSKIIITR